MSRMYTFVFFIFVFSLPAAFDYSNPANSGRSGRGHQQHW